MNKHLPVATLILAAGLAAPAQAPDSKAYGGTGKEWIQEVHGPLPAAKAIKVISTAGAIHIQGAQQPNITYIAREHVRANSEEAARRTLAGLRFSAGSGELAWLKAECDGSNKRYTDFEIQAPAQTAMVKLETDGGVGTVNNISGKVIANTGSGRIKLDQVGGPIFASSGGGDIDIGKVGSDVKAETGGGALPIESAGGAIAARDVVGRVNMGIGENMIRVRMCGRIMWGEIGGDGSDESVGAGLR